MIRQTHSQKLNTTGSKWWRACVKALLASSLLLSANLLRADIAVVVNPANGLNSLSEREVTDLFLGRYVAFPDGSAALPLDQPLKSDIRKHFYESLTGKSVRQINAYWAKLVFSGRATPPRSARRSEDITNMINNNLNAIAYMPSEDVTDDVKVVLLIDSEAMKNAQQANNK